MNIYEVIYSGPQREEGNDIAFLVRAPDFKSAVREVIYNGGMEVKGKFARTVHELGVEVTMSPKELPQILRGPYYTQAFNYGWKKWERKIEGSDYIDDWDKYE